MKTRIKNSVRLPALIAGLGLILASASSAVAAVHYVDVTSTNATPPYSSWATAATNIQDAVDAAVAGDEIVVTDGDYSKGFRTVAGVRNRLVVDKALSVRSVNGPQSTIIHGLGGLSGRCAYLTNGASLSGFTLTRGNVQPAWGGAVRGESQENCTLNNCTLIDNYSGGAGGGAVFCTLNNCTLSGNSAYQSGGGAYLCTLNNCTLTGNSAADGGGAFDCTLNNCTLTGNSAAGTGGPGSRGGAVYCIENNCILFGNTNPSGCEDCGSPGQLSGNNWYGNPLFADQTSGNLRLQHNSPCINAGNNSYVTSATDLDGNPRIVRGIVDIGAYEFQWPQLTITPSAANVILTWPTNNAGYDYTGFTLQSTTNLVSPAVWATNSPAPVVIGGQNVVTNPITGPQQFFRLSQ